jgi:hypothetical protein
VSPDELRVAATPRPWMVRRGYGPDKFSPKGYRYVQFGPTEKQANGRGTDQLKPADAELIVAAITHYDRCAADEALTEIEKLASEVHDDIWAEPFDETRRKLASDGIWRIHQIVRPLLLADAPKEGAG